MALPGENPACLVLVHMLIDDLLKGNEEFRRGVFVRDADHYRRLLLGQNPGVLWLGCSDSRVVPELITNSPPGVIFVQRNVGNIVPVHDWNFAAVLEYAVRHLKVKEIVICGHSQCGAIRAMDSETNDVYIPLWLNNSRHAKERVDHGAAAPATEKEKERRYRAIEEENVRLQIEHLLTYPLVRAAVDDGKVTVHGMHYDLETGLLMRLT